MISKTSNYGLSIIPSSQDQVYFIKFRDALAGDRDDSNMQIIDKTMYAISRHGLYVCSASPLGSDTCKIEHPEIRELFDGLTLLLIPASGNTDSAMNLMINTLGSVPLKKISNGSCSDLTAGDLKALYPALVYYNKSENCFILSTASVQPGTLTQKGIVQLTSAVSDDETTAATPKLVKNVQDSAIPLILKGRPAGVAELDGEGKIPASQLPPSIQGCLKYMGQLDASLGEFPGSCGEGNYWIASCDGTLGASPSSLNVTRGDWLLYQNNSWTLMQFKPKDAGEIKLTPETAALLNITADEEKNLDKAIQMTYQSAKNSSQQLNGIYFWKGTKAEYDAAKAASEIDDTTMCFITDDVLVPESVKIMISNELADTLKLPHGSDLDSAITSVNSRMSNENLLDNWDFRNPVNQRGFTSGSTTPTSMYFIDRWRSYINVTENTTYTLEADGLGVEVSSGYGGIAQMLEFPPDKGLYTFSAIIDGELKSLTFDAAAWNAQAGETAALTALTYYDRKTVRILFHDSNVKHIVEAVKLEKGSQSTLLNDPPANYGEQLAKCQRYQINVDCSLSTVPVMYGFKINNKVLQMYLPLPTTLRGISDDKPKVTLSGNIKIISADGTNYTFSRVDAVRRINTGLMFQIATEQDTPNGMYLIYITGGGNIFADANL